MILKVSNFKFFNSLQIFRGIAALMVVFHHQWNAFSHFMNYESHYMDFLATMGKYGVDFFFVLSGFIITYSNFYKRGLRREIGHYFRKRLLRIYVPYLPIGLTMLVLYTFFESVSAVNRQISWFTSLTLIPHGAPALSVAWTLIHEMVFYIIFIIWFITRRGFNYFILMWSLIILDHNYFHFLVDMNYVFNGSTYLFSFYNLAFILGHFLARLYMKFPKSYKGLGVLGIGCFLLVLYLSWIDFQLFSHAFNFLMFASFGLIIWGGLNSELIHFSNESILMILGNASYSIYLLHNPLLSFLVRVFPNTETLSLNILIFIFAFFLCCFFGIIYSKIFEEFLVKRIKSSIVESSVLTIKP